MEQYFEHIPWFLAFVLVGAGLNLLRTWIRTRKPIPWFRIIEEVFGSVFVAAIVAGGLDALTAWPALFIYGISALGGYAHSAILDFVGNGMLKYFLDILKSRWSKPSFGPEASPEDIEGVEEIEKSPDLSDI